MLSGIEILAFIILGYTVYLILTDKKKVDGENNDNQNEEVKQKDNAGEAKVQRKSKKSVPVQKIEDDADTLTQGRNYMEQSSNEAPRVTDPSQQHFEEVPNQQQSTMESQAPSSKNQEPIPQAIETVSVICPYCDNKVLVPKGGSAECSCCSSMLNDSGGIVD